MASEQQTRRPRGQFRQPVGVLLEGKFSISSATMDISVGGVRCEFNGAAMPVGKEVLMTLFVPRLADGFVIDGSDGVITRATILYHQGKSVAFRFSKLKDEDTLLIEEYLSDRSSASANSRLAESVLYENADSGREKKLR